MPDLQPFEGTPVVSTGFILRKASGGLNAALVVNNLELHKDDEVTFAVRCKVHSLNFPPVKDTDGVQRVHVLDILSEGGVAVIDDATVSAALDAQRRLVEEQRGVNRLAGITDDEPQPFEDDDEADDPGDAPPE